MIFPLYQKFQNLFKDQRFSEIMRGSVWALSAHVISAALGFVIMIIIARIYGANILGTVAVLQSFFVLTTIVTVLGTNTSILRLIPEHLAKYSPGSAFKVYAKTQFFVAGISILAGVVLFIGAGYVAENIFSKPHLKFYFALASVFIIFKSLMLFNQQAVRGLRLIRMFAFMQLLPQFSKLLLLIFTTVFFFHPGNPVYALLGSFAVTSIFGAIVMNRMFRRQLSPEDTIHYISLRDILTLSLPMLMTSTMMFVIGETGVLMLGIFRTEAEVGHYVVAVKIATLSTFVLTAINSMAAPKFSELYHSGKIDDLFYVAKRSAKLIFWTTTPMLLAFIIFGKPLLTVVFDAEYLVAYPALVLLVLGQFINSISGATGYFMNMTGHQNMFRNIVFFAALSNLVLNVLLTPQHGLWGAALAAMFSIMFWNIATLCYIKVKYGRTTGYFPLLS